MSQPAGDPRTTAFGAEETKCLNQEFVVVGWSDPEGSRHRIGALPRGYYTPDGKLIYVGRAGTGNARTGAGTPVAASWSPSPWMPCP